ncbi:MAG: hypothetical protein EBW73_05700 [Betaproteobacteria bacterium]|nr:hypothetical protein [Betaproteobacteria bacterium]
MRRPEDFWPIEDECLEQYLRFVGYGHEEAARSSVAIVAIARNIMPAGENTLLLLDELAARFRSAKFYCFENDSADQTIAVLDEFATTRPWVTVEHATLDRPDYRGFEEPRTYALAEYRNRCRQWVERNAADAQYVVVLDMDPHGGFLPDGVFNSIYWLMAAGRRGSPTGQAYGVPGALGDPVLRLFQAGDPTTPFATNAAWSAGDAATAERDQRGYRKAATAGTFCPGCACTAGARASESRAAACTARTCCAAAELSGFD